VEDKNPTVKPEPKKVDKKTEKAAAGDDKVVGKDDKGRTIYEGQKGGRYYINSNGNKSYIKKDN
jgi:colicin import membrane protein